MNREIKFRMKDKQGEWQYVEMVCSIIEALKDPVTPGGIDIDENTIGQYTGLDDKNGKEIYEGDIVKYRDSRGQHIEKVIFDKGCFYAGMHWGSSTRVAPKLINTRITEVIGNMYDNPELLGGE